MVSGDLGEEEDREVEGDRSARIELMASVVGEVTSVCLTDGTVDVDAGVLGGLQSTRWSSSSARSLNGWLQRSHQQFNTAGGGGGVVGLTAEVEVAMDSLTGKEDD